MGDKKKDELREIADEFDFLRQLIRARMDAGDPQRDSNERNQTSELIAGRIVAAQHQRTINLNY